MFSGRLKNNREKVVEHTMLIQEDDNKIQSSFWDLETIGIKHISVEDEIDEIIDIFHSNIRQNGRRYQVSWPWKLCKSELPNNYLLAEASLKSLVNNLQKDEATMQRYNEIIQKLIVDDIVEDADNSKEYLQGESVITHYLPHHMVQGNDGKKLRVVYEGCAKTHKSKRSLNECLHPGKNLVANLCGILLRFHMKRIAFVADIEKVYLQLELNPSDRDVTRFLWLKDVKKPVSKDNIRELRFYRVIWGIISAAFLLASTIMYHLMSYNTPVAQDISSNLYVDNLISGTDSVCSAKDYYDETKMIFNKAAMNICKWVCNDDTVMTHYKDEDKVNETEVKVLGMMWRVNTDALYFHKPNIIDPEVVSKRSILKAISAVYDPLGLVSPILLQPKLLLQSLWRKKIDWDKEIPKEYMKVWRRFKDDLFYIDKIRIERPINSGIPHYETIQLVTFTDASKNAYAATVYLKTSNEISSKVKLVFSKTRISPIKSILTIPLTGAHECTDWMQSITICVTPVEYKRSEANTFHRFQMCH